MKTKKILILFFAFILIPMQFGYLISYAFSSTTSVQLQTTALTSAFPATSTSISSSSTTTIPISSSTTYCSQNQIVDQNAPWYCSQINQAMISNWDTWAPVAMVALFISFDLALIIYIASVLFADEKLKNFAIGEFYEAIATGLIVIGFLSLAATILGLIPSLIVNANPYTTSLSYISNTISTTQSLTSQLFQIAVADKSYTSTGLEICASLVCSSNIIGVFSFAINYLFYLPAVTLITYFLDGLTVLYGEFYIILIFMYAAIPVFLIPGIILRALLPTRALGGLMIALAIGFYVIMPTFFSVAFYFTNTNLLNQLNSEAAYFGQNSAGGEAQLNAASQTGPLVIEANLAEQGMGTFWLSVLFYPALIFAMTYALVTQLAQLIGGATQTSSRFKIL